MGFKTRKLVKRYVQARPAAANPRWCAAWWPRSPGGDLAWVTIHPDGMSWTTVPDKSYQIRLAEIEEVQEFFAEENAPRKFEFRTRKGS